jgi:predicted permease
MTWMKRWRRRLLALVRPTAVDAELNEELAFHLEQETEKHIRTGLDSTEARRRALAEFGGVTRYTEEVREARFFAWAHHASRDLRYALRGMRQRPGFVSAILITLGLGIGASVAMFATANALFFRPLPFADADRLQMLVETNPEFGWTDADAAPANFLDWRERVKAFDDVAAYSRYGGRATHIQDGEPRLLDVTEVTGNFFDVLGVRPAIGRGFRWDETWLADSRVVMLSHEAWVSDFGSDAGIVGRSIQLGTQSYEVVGVMARSFSFPIAGTDIWKPFGWDPANRAAVFFRRAHWIRPVARLTPGVTPEQAASEFQVVVQQLQQEFPETNRVMGAGMDPLRGFLMKDLRKPVLVLLGAVGVLLLLACANVANLALLRALGRGHEIALRTALGASRARVASMLSIEHGLLALAGGVLGTSLAWGALRALGLTDFGVPAATGLAFDARVYLFAVGATALCGLLFGAAPVLLATRQGSVDGTTLKAGERGAAGGPGSGKFVSSLVALEVALAVMLVAGAGLMARTAYQLRKVDVGFNAENVLALQFGVSAARYQDRDAVLAFYDRFIERLEATPGIERAGLVGQLPLAGTSWSSSLKAEGWAADRVGNNILHRRADRGYFEALGIPLIRGRYLDPTDRGDAPFAVVVNQTFAREHFADEDPIGKRIAYDRNPTPTSTWYQIVGIVGDQHQESPAKAARAEVFESSSQDWGRNNWVVVRTSLPALSMVPSVRQTLRELDPLIPIAVVRTLDDVKRESMAREDSVLGLLTAFGALALLLATVGVYAVAAQSARQRTREIGIRIALGAKAADILGLVLKRGLIAVSIGLATGLAATLLASRALETLLYGVEASDPGTIGGVAVLLLLVGAVACWVPARWATRVDPVRSLKME